MAPPAKQKPKRYKQRDKDAAVEMYLSGPNGMREVAHALGMSRHSLWKWVQDYRAAHPEDKR